ncbi:MAG: divalent-cation tolerance protein CutA [Kofleriaceae bacterium]|nr:divalent-cation tolerance protein CutA [Kofleriaceae bacterium]
MADSSNPGPVVVAFSTFPSPEKAAEVARILVTEGLIACANLVPAVRSIYRWQGEVSDDTETLAILKTTRARFDEMKTRLVALHPYEVAEVIALPVDGGHAPYLAWVIDSTK